MAEALWSPERAEEVTCKKEPPRSPEKRWSRRFFLLSTTQVYFSMWYACGTFNFVEPGIPCGATVSEIFPDFPSQDWCKRGNRCSATVSRIIGCGVYHIFIGFSRTFYMCLWYKCSTTGGRLWYDCGTGPGLAGLAESLLFPGLFAVMRIGLQRHLGICVAH